MAALPRAWPVHLPPLPPILTLPRETFGAILSSPRARGSLGLARCSYASVSRKGQGEYDPDLRLVLELATDSELHELERILFGPSYFSPLLKSVTRKVDVDYAMIKEDLEEREDYIVALESRFLFLAADARSTLRGWRPSYRNVLLAIRKKLNIPCSSKLSTEDLEAEIFLHLIKGSISEESESSQSFWDFSNEPVTLQLEANQVDVQHFTAQKLGVAELPLMFLKGASMFTISKVYQFLAKRLTGKVLLEAANYQIKKEVVKKGGQLAAINLESRAALLAAKQGLAGAASRYLGFRSMISLLGPIMWGTFLADVVIQMLGTDYARILQAIYALAQIRITRTYRLPSDDLRSRRLQ